MSERPRFLELTLNAELGAYQDEPDYGNLPLIEFDLDDLDETSAPCVA
jgi:hypothetical protein